MIHQSRGDDWAVGCPCTQFKLRSIYLTVQKDVFILRVTTMMQSHSGSGIDFFSHGTRIHGKYFAAEGLVKGNFLLMHGLTSNSAWFGSIASVLAKHGYSVLIYDRRGSGKSAGTRGDIPQKDAFLWDLKAAANFIWSQNSQPTHLVSFSYSWKLAPLFLQELKTGTQRIESLIFVAPASDLRKQVKPKLRDQLKVLLNWKGPYFETNVRDFHLTQDQETLEWIRHSQESRPVNKFTRRFLLASQEMDKAAAEIIPEIRKPMLIVLPQEDNVIDLAKVRERFAKAPIGSRRMITEIAGGHIVDSRRAQKQMIDQVLKWVQSPQVVLH